MKLYTQIAISLLCLISLLSSQVVGQENYVLLPDVSGYDRSSYENTLIDFSNKISTTLSIEGLSDKFRVFDSGLYRYNNITEGGSMESVQFLVDLADNYSSDILNYILFIKESDQDGINNKVRVILKLEGLSVCLDQIEIDLINNIIQSIEYDGNVGSYESYINSVLFYLNDKLNKVINCTCTEGFKNESNKKSLTTCNSSYNLQDLITIANNLDEDLIIYCQNCEETDIVFTETYFNLSESEQEKLYRCIFGQIIEGGFILYDGGIDDLLYGQLPDELQSIGISTIDDEILLYDLKVCYPNINEEGFCGADWQLNTDFNQAINASINDCLLSEVMALNQSNLTGSISRPINKKQDLLNQLSEITDWLSNNEYKATYYFLDSQNQSMTKVDQSGSQTSQDINIMSDWAEEYAQNNFSENENQSFWLDIDAFNNVRINSQINRNNIVVNEIYDDPNNIDIAIDILEQYGRDLLSSSENFSYSLIAPGSTSTSVDAGEVEVREGGFLQWPTFIYEEGRHVITKGELDEGLWLETEAKHAVKLLTTGKVVAGASDACITEYKDLVEMVSGIGKFCIDPYGELTNMHTALSQINIEALEKAFDNEIDLLTNEGPRQYYEVTKVGTRTVITVTKILSSGGLVVIIKEIDDLLKFFAKIGDWCSSSAKVSWNALSDAKKKLFAEDFLDKIVANDPDLVALLSNGDGVKAWDNWNAFPNLRNRVDLLENYYPKRSKILIDVEELFPGCHSIARHGHHLPLDDMRLRVIGEHPSMGQSRSALKFDTPAIHDASVNKAFNDHKVEIEAHFANGGGYREWDSQLSGRVGEGYTNTGTINNPSSQYVTSNKVKITFDVDPSNPTGYKMISGYPWYEL